MPGAELVARVKRRASVPYASIKSSGLIALPLLLLIFSPFSSRIRPCRYTVRKGTAPVKCSPAIIMRATQKNRIS